MDLVVGEPYTFYGNRGDEDAIPVLVTPEIAHLCDLLGPPLGCGGSRLVFALGEDSVFKFEHGGELYLDYEDPFVLQNDWELDVYGRFGFTGILLPVERFGGTDRVLVASRTSGSEAVAVVYVRRPVKLHPGQEVELCQKGRPFVGDVHAVCLKHVPDRPAAAAVLDLVRHDPPEKRKTREGGLPAEPYEHAFRTAEREIFLHDPLEHAVPHERRITESRLITRQ